MEPQGQLAEMMWANRFEYDQRDFVSRYLKKGMIFINIGANSGLYTLMASKLVADGVVHAFEPSSENFARLSRNIALNGAQNVTAHKMALSDFSGDLALCSDENLPEADGHFHVKKVPHGGASVANQIELVPCTTLDDYWESAYPGPAKPVDMIVIDVEGAEIDVFRGAVRTFACSPKLAIFFESTQRLDEIDELLRSYGFHFYEWDAKRASLQECAIKPGCLIAMRNPNFIGAK